MGSMELKEILKSKLYMGFFSKSQSFSLLVRTYIMTKRHKRQIHWLDHVLVCMLAHQCEEMSCTDRGEHSLPTNQ